MKSHISGGTIPALSGVVDGLDTRRPKPTVVSGRTAEAAAQTGGTLSPLTSVAQMFETVGGGGACAINTTINRLQAYGCYPAWSGGGGAAMQPYRMTLVSGSTQLY